MSAPSELSDVGSFGSPRSAEATLTHGIVLFVALAVAWSWGFGFVAYKIKADWPLPSATLMILAGFGPSLAGLAVVALSTGSAGRRTWMSRCLNWRVGSGWCFLAFLAPPAVMVCALVLHVALGGSLPAFPAVSQIPLVIANFGLVLLVGGPLGEEFGWRGYLMPALTARMNWRAASLLVGVVWGLWHLPLFFMAGTAQALMPIPVFLLNILAGSVLFGWLFERTQRSIFPVLLLHTSLNAFAGVLGIVPTAATAQPYMLVTGLLILIAAVLLILPDSKSFAESA